MKRSDYHTACWQMPWLALLLAVAPLSAAANDVDSDRQGIGDQAAVSASAETASGANNGSQSRSNLPKGGTVDRKMEAHGAVSAQSGQPGHATSTIEVDVDRLKERLKDSDAIGFFTKIAIRNDIVDLVDRINSYRKDALLDQKMDELRASFDGLLLKIVALLENDPALSHDLYVGRESIWKSLLEVKA